MGQAFIALSWLPKATVQAALASVPLELIEEYKKDDADYFGWGEDIVTVAVVSIILTAPAGVFIINNLGQRWLQKNDKADLENGAPPTRANMEKQNDMMTTFKELPQELHLKKNPANGFEHQRGAGAGGKFC